MKRRDLIRHLEGHACTLLREGSNHSLYASLETGAWASVPRHREIRDSLAREICKQLGIPRP
jgi:mRNA interferase HicA